MAVSLGGNGKERRKPVAADLNLVPYIDLLTCMVAFLLITAVWSQLARLSVAQKGQGGDTTVESGPRIAVLVGADSFNVIVDNDQKPIPKRNGALDYARLADELRAVKHAHPDETTAQILSEDGIVFDTLVRTMDRGARTLGSDPAQVRGRRPRLRRCHLGGPRRGRRNGARFYAGSPRLRRSSLEGKPSISASSLTGPPAGGDSSATEPP